MAGKQEIVWISGYPFVDGVNAPKINGGQAQAVGVKPKPAPIVSPDAHAISHDLKADQTTDFHIDIHNHV